MNDRFKYNSKMKGAKRTKKHRKKKKKRQQRKSQKASIKKMEFNPTQPNLMPITKKYISEISNGQYTCATYEAGGGGDCLYWTVSSGLEMARGVSKVNEYRKFTMQDIRNIVGDEIAKWSDEKFKEFIEICKVSQKYGEWCDKWNPAYVPNQNILSKIYKIKGNIHWGTDLDISILSKKLNVGIIVIQFGRMYCIPVDEKTEKKKKKYYMLIYNNGGHYQLMGVKNKKMNKYHAIFLHKDIPKFLKDEYLKVCKKPLV